MALAISGKMSSRDFFCDTPIREMLLEFPKVGNIADMVAFAVLGQVFDG